MGDQAPQLPEWRARGRADTPPEAAVAHRGPAEEQLHRALRGLYSCNHALTRATAGPALLREICRIIVEVVGYRLCWVGYAEDDAAKTVRPVAQAGYEEGYLETVNVTWADDERGRGPAGTPSRTGEPFVVRDAATDPGFAPWREEALKRGYASVLGLPLWAPPGLRGALTIYAAEPDAFDDEEVSLLRALADDLAYGITALRTRASHARAQEELRRAHDELEARVAERTEALAQANFLLQAEIAERRRAEEAVAERARQASLAAEVGVAAPSVPAWPRGPTPGRPGGVRRRSPGRCGSSSRRTARSTSRWRWGCYSCAATRWWWPATARRPSPPWGGSASTWC